MGTGIVGKCGFCQVYATSAGSIPLNTRFGLGVPGRRVWPHAGADLTLETGGEPDGGSGQAVEARNYPTTITASPSTTNAVATPAQKWRDMMKGRGLDMANAYHVSRKQPCKSGILGTFVPPEPLGEYGKNG